MIKRYQDISFAGGGILFRLFLFMLVAHSAHGQLSVHYTCNNLSINTFGKSIQGKLQLDILNESGKTIDTITLVNWPAAYKPRGTYLAEELLEDQTTSLRFAKREELGVAGLTYSLTNFKDEQFIISEEVFQVPSS